MTNKEIADLIRSMDSALRGEFGGGPDPEAEQAIAALEAEPLAVVEGWISDISLEQFAKQESLIVLSVSRKGAAWASLPVTLALTPRKVESHES